LPRELLLLGAASTVIGLAAFLVAVWVGPRAGFLIAYGGAAATGLAVAWRRAPAEVPRRTRVGVIIGMAVAAAALG
jgi:hypothetical protein